MLLQPAADKYDNETKNFYRQTEAIRKMWNRIVTYEIDYIIIIYKRYRNLVTITEFIQEQ